jgi:hypothetical protein
MRNPSVDQRGLRLNGGRACVHGQPVSCPGWHPGGATGPPDTFLLPIRPGNPCRFPGQDEGSTATSTREMSSWRATRNGLLPTQCEPSIRVYQSNVRSGGGCPPRDRHGNSRRRVSISTARRRNPSGQPRSRHLLIPGEELPYLGETVMPPGLKRPERHDDRQRPQCRPPPRPRRQ